MVLPTPDNAKGWLGVIWPLLNAATPISLLILALGVWYLLGQMRQVREVNQGLWQQLLASYQVQVELARDCRREEPHPPRHEEHPR